MKRWNGWGNVDTDYPVPPSAREYLNNYFGSLETNPDVSVESILRSIPDSRLPKSPQIDTSGEMRLRYTRGQSLADFVALRSGQIPVFPDAVAFPESEEQVRKLLQFARHTEAIVIPYGGGSSVVGHINPPPSEKPVLTISMEKMNRLIDMDEIGQTAVFEAGIAGPALERTLGNRGFTLGHFPQSHEYSTLGGWIATRSSGQQSYHYGRIEQLFAGGRMETPRGGIDLPHFPASAAGPDVKEMVLGSEGRMGIITQARVRISRLPQVEEFFGVFFGSWEEGVEAVRQMAQERLGVSMLRLSSPQETETTLILSGKSWINAATRGLTMLGYGTTRCLLIFGVTGGKADARRTRRNAISICREHGGLFTGSTVGHTWQKSRFYTPYLRNTLWETGVALDTLETAIPWKNVIPAAEAISDSIIHAMERHGEKVLAFAHLSHIYRDAASIYTTFLFRRTSNPEELLTRWRDMKRSASVTIQKWGGTITHQHGIGTDHAPYLETEKGALGMDALRALSRVFDPEGMMNPGKLIT